MMTSNSSRDTVLAAIADGVARSDAEIEAITGLAHSKASPARVALWRDGLVERVGRDERGHWLWQLCPPERQDATKLVYRDHQEKLLLRRLTNKSPRLQANIVLDLLADNKVDNAVIAQLGRRKHHRRIRRRVNNARADRAQESRQRKRQIAEEHEEADAALNFMIIVDRLRDSIDALLNLQEQVEKEVERYRETGVGRIGVSEWPSVRNNILEVLQVARVVFGDITSMMGEPATSCPICGERIGAAGHELDEGYVDAEVVEEGDDLAKA
jgi:hypothetical protein